MVGMWTYLHADAAEGTSRLYFISHTILWYASAAVNVWVERISPSSVIKRRAVGLVRPSAEGLWLARRTFSPRGGYRPRR